MKKKLLEKAKTLPKCSGCYLMKNSREEIIYVGKAKNLKSRVTSYFNESAKNTKTQILVRHIRSFDFIITDSDVESYVLENNLIKKHAPKYNIRLKDDKSYPYVVINQGKDFPRLLYLRRPKRKKNHLMFGPYPQGSGISYIIKSLTKAFRLRDCSDHELNNRKTPCLLYQIHQCSAPCVGKISKEDYAKDLQQCADFLEGKRKAKAVLSNLEEKMVDLAKQELFEQAAVIRDQIENLKPYLEQDTDQSVENIEDEFMDVIAWYKGSEYIDLSIYMIRSGNLLGHKSFYFPVSELIDDLDEEVMSYLFQYYSLTVEEMPKKILMNVSKAHKEVFSQALEKSSQTKVKIPLSVGKYKSLLDSTMKHAEEVQRVRLVNQDSVYVALNKLKDLLKLKDRPRRIECFDVAIWQGKSPSASQVVFHEGKADKTQYRYFHLKELEEGNNDFAMMKELFERRLDNGNLPDLFVVDGGKGQLNIVREVLKETKIDIPLVSIAKAKVGKSEDFKDKEVSHTEERLFIPGRSNPFILNKSPSLFRLIVSMRDEAHRFSRVLHHKAEKKRVFSSWIDDAKGIGDRTKKKIMQKMNLPVSRLKELNENELKEMFDLTLAQARSIKETLKAVNSEHE